VNSAFHCVHSQLRVLVVSEALLCKIGRTRSGMNDGTRTVGSEEHDLDRSVCRKVLNVLSDDIGPERGHMRRHTACIRLCSYHMFEGNQVFAQVTG